MLGIEVINKKISTLLPVPGVYRMLDKDGTVLYVGKAKDLPKRLKSYIRPETLSLRIAKMVSLTCEVEVMTTHTESEALLLEASLIKKLMPKYNILLRDDKSFPYILLRQDHPFGQLVKHRGKKVKKGLYFGPFASGLDVNTTLEHLQQIFQLRSCTDSEFSRRTRPCLEYQIKRCTAPCVGLISKDDYQHLVDEATAFLQGKTTSLQQELSQEMAKASEELNYEKAAWLRDRIKAVSSIQAKQSMVPHQLQDADVVALKREGRWCSIHQFFIRSGQALGNKANFPLISEDDSDEEVMEQFLAQFYQNISPPPMIITSLIPGNHALLEHALAQLASHNVSIFTPKRGKVAELLMRCMENAIRSLESHKAEAMSLRATLQEVQALFKLSGFPKRIEVFDNSHIMGTSEVGVMIVATDEGFKKDAYRKYTIRSINETSQAHGDDLTMLKEVLTRRLMRLKENLDQDTDTVLPDLWLIDGGHGQMKIAKEVCEMIGIKIPCVAIAKGPDRNAGLERFYMESHGSFSLPRHSPVLYYLQNLRDEAHRFAIGSHRKKRAKLTLSSSLDEIPGIGGKRKKALLHHFGSVRAIEQAGIKDLMRVEGIHRRQAETIYYAFHGGLAPEQE